MRLLEAIIDANHRALAGDASAGVHVADFADALPLAALTCLDPRLTPLFPGVLGLTPQHFVWLRHAGNIIIDPLGGALRSLALSCVVNGSREIAIIGHTDCRAGQTSIAELTTRFKELGIDRSKLPDNLAQFFGMFASERQNVLRGVEVARRSPLIAPKIPVHGLLVDTATGKLEWLVNGYQALEQPAIEPPPVLKMPAIGASDAAFNLGEMKFPETKIGEVATTVPSPAPAAASTGVQPGKAIPVPPRIPEKPGLRVKK